jgi:Ca2+-binding RTX toxin-like protein
MGRRAILLLSAAATMVLVAAGVALAVSVTFTNAADDCNNPAVATIAADRLAMGGGRDICNGLAGNDEIFGDHASDNTGALGPGVSLYGAGGNDTIEGGTGSDTLGGGPGNDYLFAGTGEDDVDGGSGNDYINVSDHFAGNDTVNCGPGADRVVRDINPATGNVDSVVNCDGNFTNVPVSPGGP